MIEFFSKNKKIKINKKNSNFKQKQNLNYFYLDDFSLFFLFFIIFMFLFEFIILFLKDISFLTLFINLNSFFCFYIIFFIFILIFKNKIIRIFIFFLLYLSSIIFLINSFYIENNLSLKYDIFNFNFQVFLFFIKNIISINYLIYLTLIFLTPLVLFFIFKNKFDLNYFKNYKIKLKSLILIFIFSFILIIISFIKFYSLISNPYLIGIYNIINSNSYNYTIKIDSSNYDNINFSNYDINKDFSKEFDNYSKYNVSNKKRVLLFVMEQTIYDDFINEIQKIPKEKNFFYLTKNFSHYYLNYYTTNQDSRTATWSLFFSQIPPFESYIDDWSKKYGKIIENKNLVDFFKSKNYTTAVAASLTNPSLLLGVFLWDNLIFIDDFQKAKKDYFCLDNLRYESGCEDLVIYPKILNLIKNNDKLFLYEEMIYGHGVEYMNAKEMSRTKYYNDYFLKLYNDLEKNNLLNNTIIIITSDHGEKGYYDKSLDDYHIPLVIIDKNLKFRENKNLYSHLDFKDILIDYLSNDYQKLFENFTKTKNIFIVGQTQSGEFAFIDSKNDFILSKQISEDKYSIINTNMKDKDIKNVLLYFKKYQVNMIKKSNMKNYWCYNCQINLKKFNNLNSLN